MKKVDVAIIGAGPAGLMAAVRAASLGKHVILLEKNNLFGQKIILSGHGRCNFTNELGIDDITEFIKKYGPNGKFLYSAFSKFSPEMTVEFFRKNGIQHSVERGRRIFPASGDAQNVISMFCLLIKRYGIELYRNSKVLALKMKDSKIEHLITRYEEIFAKKYIITTGGLSYPETGSTGDGYRFAEQAGHTIIPTYPALVPVKTKETWVKLANGCDLRGVWLSVYLNGENVANRFGEMEFTNFGLSGPIVMDLSSEIPDWLKNKDDVLEFVMDLKPSLSRETLIARIYREISKEPDKGYEVSVKRYSTLLRSLMPAKLIRLIVELTDIPHDKPVEYLSHQEIETLADTLKHIKLTINGLWSYKNALVTRGGVNLKEVDPSTMRSKLCENMYFAGEVLDLNGPSGGYNLQMCWSTGYVAGSD